MKQSKEEIPTADRLITAAKTGDYETLTELVVEAWKSHIVDIDVLLQLAASNGKTKCVKYLYELREQDPNGPVRDPLGAAAINGHTETVQYLLTTHCGNSIEKILALYRAKEVGQIEICKIILRTFSTTRIKLALAREEGEFPKELTEEEIQRRNSQTAQQIAQSETTLTL